MKYKFKYKKGLFWKSKTVSGHRLDKDNNRMDLFLEDGSIYSISQWDKYDLYLGIDWVLENKKQMEKEAGQNITLNIKEK